MTNPKEVAKRLRDEIHVQSSIVAPRTTRTIEVMRDAADLLEASTPVDEAGLREACDWPADLTFRFHDEPGEHDPCYVIMPGGAMLPLAHHGLNGVDQARARFIVAACNAAIAGSISPSHTDLMLPPEDIDALLETRWHRTVNVNGDSPASLLQEIKEAIPKDFLGIPVVSFTITKKNRDAFIEAVEESLKAAMRRLVSVDEEWKTIDSAPKDGTAIWAYFPRSLRKEPCYRVRWQINAYEAGPNWTLDDGESACLTYDPPTHYRQIPKPPHTELPATEGGEAELRNIARNVLRRGAPVGCAIPKCKCFADGGRNARDCEGVCEDAVDHVVSALRRSRPSPAPTWQPLCTAKPNMKIGEQIIAMHPANDYAQMVYWDEGGKHGAHWYVTHTQGEEWIADETGWVWVEKARSI